MSWITALVIGVPDVPPSVRIAVENEGDSLVIPLDLITESRAEPIAVSGDREL
jgi:hypothetical protein